MQTISLDGSNFPQTAIVSVLTFSAVALLAVVLAYWTWAWLGPRPEPRTQPAAQAGDRIDAARHLFGSVQGNPSVAAPTGIAITLLGIVAATEGNRGYAMVQLDAKGMLAVREGEDIAPGVRLAQVASDHVILERGGVRETLAWPKKTPAAESTLPLETQ